MSGVGLTGMEPLVEVNNEAEMERALAVGSKAIHPSNTVKLSGRTASNRIQEPILLDDFEKTESGRSPALRIQPCVAAVCVVYSLMHGFGCMRTWML
jgi:hypothetical protein